MQNEIMTFDSPEFGQVRTVGIDGELWLVGKDVAEALGYSNSRKALADHVDAEDKGVTKCDTLGGTQDLTIINESGLYSLVLSSKLPRAKEFKRWVTSEILPSIRKHGMYATAQTVEQMLTDPDSMIKILTTLKEEREQRKILEDKIAAERPATLLGYAVSTAEDDILIRDLAKLLTQNGCVVGERRLYDRLRNEGYLIKSGSDRNMPTQRAVEQGLFRIKETVITTQDSSVTRRVTKVTGKGQMYFINKLCGVKH